MDKMWRDEGRKGQPHNNSTGGKDQPPSGFEGMNYEQKRRPYYEGEKNDKDLDSNNGDHNSRRRNDLN